MIWHLTRALLAAVSLAFLDPSRALAFSISDFVSDPLGLTRSASTLSASLDRTLGQLSKLESQTNEDISKDLEQIRSIIKEASSSISSDIDKATADMFALEQKVNGDVFRLIYRVQCLSANVDDELQAATSRVIGQIAESKPRTSILGIPVVRFQVSPTTIKDADDVYREAKKAKLEILNETVNDDTPAATIFWAYQDLEKLAKWTQCRYLNQAAEVAFTSEISEYERLSQPWINTVHAKNF